MTPAQLEALSKIVGADAGGLAVLAMYEDDDFAFRRLVERVAAACRVTTEAAAELTTETVRAQLSASLATGDK